MRVIIAGSREGFSGFDVSIAYAESGFQATQIISGGARGVDTFAIKFATDEGIPFLEIKAEWSKYGKSAGYRRNVQMAEQADALIALWDGKSKGTKHMIDIAESKGLETFVWKQEKRYHVKD